MSTCSRPEVPGSKGSPRGSFELAASLGIIFRSDYQLNRPEAVELVVGEDGCPISHGVP